MSMAALYAAKTGVNHSDRCCDTCISEHRNENATALNAKGLQAIAQMRVEGYDPGHGWKAACEEEHDPEIFAREILPKLEGMPLNVMIRATGLSRQYCSLIRREIKVPHPRHWRVIGDLRIGG